MLECVSGVEISPVAVAPAELAALMHHGIILDRCCYLCSVSKPIILTQIYVNTAVSWQRMGFAHIHTHTRRKLKVLFGLALPQWMQRTNQTRKMCLGSLDMACLQVREEEGWPGETEKRNFASCLPRGVRLRSIDFRNVLDMNIKHRDKSFYIKHFISWFFCLFYFYKILLQNCDFSSIFPF